MPYSGHPTPDLPPSEIGFVCKPIFVPDIPELWDCLYGQISEMTRAYYWKQVGTMTPAQAAFLWARALGMTDVDKLCTYEESNNCLEYPTNDTDIITFEPTNPYAQWDVIPAGYILPPFVRYGNFIPDFVPDIFEDAIEGWATNMTGYLPTDVLTLAGNFPFAANWFNEFADGLPRFKITVEGKGRVLLHLLQVPLGGRALITVDLELNIPGIISGLITENYKMIELERDEISVPSEVDIDHIEEVELTTDGQHIIYVTFIPVIDIDEIPLKFGGGLRSIEWCPETSVILPIDCTYIKNCFDADPDTIAMNEITVVNMNGTTQEFLDDLETLYTDSPQDIDPDIPEGIPPTTIERNALCHALNSWLQQYVEAKKAKLRSKNFMAQSWSAMQNAIVDAYGVLNNVVGWIIPDNLFSCFVDDATALTVLSDAAAIEDLQCCLFEEMRSVPLLTTTLAGAIAACVTSLSGTDAGKLACILDNDLNLQHTLNFYYVYGKTIERQAAGTVFDCPCPEPTGITYIEYDFEVSEHGFIALSTTNYVEGVGFVGQNIDPDADGGDRMYASINKDMPEALYKVHAIGIAALRSGGDGSGDNLIGAFVQSDAGTNIGGNSTNFTPNAAPYYWTVTASNQFAGKFFGQNRVSGQSVNSPTSVIKRMRVWLAADSPIKGLEHPTPFPQTGQTAQWDGYWT
jgi:hypothetical protein